MFHPTLAPHPTTTRPTAPQPAPIAGGEAWVVPFEPGGAVWVTATAPAISVVDRRAGRRTATR